MYIISVQQTGVDRHVHLISLYFQPELNVLVWVCPLYSLDIQKEFEHVATAFILESLAEQDGLMGIVETLSILCIIGNKCIQYILVHACMYNLGRIQPDLPQ